MLGADVMLMRIENWHTTGWIVKSHDCYMILQVFNAQANSGGAMQAITRFQLIYQDKGYRTATI